MTNPALVVPGALDALQAVGRSVRGAGLPATTLAADRDGGCLAGGAVLHRGRAAALALAIATINAFNRINAATRQIAGDWVGQWVSHQEQTADAAAS